MLVEDMELDYEDAFLGFILGSVLSRAINSEAPFLETIAGTMGLVFMHSIFAVSMSMRDSAMKSWIICFSASSDPCE